MLPLRGIEKRCRASLCHRTPYLRCAVDSRYLAMPTNFRTEADSMGPMQVPADAYYGAQTARAVENFPISNLRFPRAFIRAVGLIKKHAAATNAALGFLPQKIAEAIQKAAEEVIEAKLDGQFVVDIY